MFFVSKKKYNALMKERNEWKYLSESFLDSAEQFQKRADEWRDVAVSCQEDNKRLVAHEKEMLAKMEELKAKLYFAIKQRDCYYDLLENTSEVEEKDE